MELGLSLALDDVKIEQDGTVLLPGRLLVDVVRSLPDGELTLALRAEQRDVELTAGGARFHLRTLPAEDFPRLPEADGEPAKLPAAPAGGDDRARRPRRVARRGPPDPHRRSRPGRGLDADDGGDRLLPAVGQAHRARVRALRADRGERPRARAARAGADRRVGGGRGRRDRDAAQPGDLPRRRGHPQLEADRGAVPELAPARARNRSSTTSACPARSFSRSPAE